MCGSKYLAIILLAIISSAREARDWRGLHIRRIGIVLYARIWIVLAMTGLSYMRNVPIVSSGRIC